MDAADSGIDHGASCKYRLLASELPPGDQANREGVERGDVDTGKKSEMETEEGD